MRLVITRIRRGLIWLLALAVVSAVTSSFLVKDANTYLTPADSTSGCFTELEWALAVPPGSLRMLEKWIGLGLVATSIIFVFVAASSVIHCRRGPP